MADFASIVNPGEEKEFARKAFDVQKLVERFQKTFTSIEKVSFKRFLCHNVEIVQCLFSLQSFILIVVTRGLSIKDNTVLVLNNALIACDVRSAVSRSSQLFMAPVWEAALTLSPPATSDTAQAMPSFKSKCVTFMYLFLHLALNAGMHTIFLFY